MYIDEQLEAMWLRGRSYEVDCCFRGCMRTYTFTVFFVVIYWNVYLSTRKHIYT